MSDEEESFQERLSKIKSKWSEGTANPDSMTAEAKRQCLEELTAVCKSLNSMRNGLVEASREDEENEEKIRIKCKIDEHMSRLDKIKDEMKSLGAKLNGQSKPALYGYLPSNWVDGTLHRAVLEKLKDKIDELEEEFEKLKPAIDHSKSIFRNGVLQDPEIILPPPTGDLRFLRKTICNDHTYVQHIRDKISSITTEAFHTRTEFHNLLFKYKPVDMKNLQSKLGKLNMERENIIYELRLFECKGFDTGFNAQDYFLE
jgi:hypothetical protein